MYNNYPTVSDEIEEIMNQYIRDTDAEYRERNRANIGKSVERFNRNLIEKYGAENLDPEDFLVISKEQYLIGEFEDCFKECQKKIEKKFLMGIPHRVFSSVEENLPKEANKESCAEYEAPAIILNDTLREMLSHPNYSEVISSFLANVNETYHMGETTTDTIDCSNIVTSEKDQYSVTQSNDSDISTTNRVAFHTISVDEVYESWSKNQRSSPLDDPSKLEFANILSTDNNHVSISNTSKGTCDSILYKRVSQLIDETTIITSSWDTKCLSQMMLANDDIKLRYGELPGLEHIYTDLECSTSSNIRKTQEHYYFDKSKKNKPIFVYSTIQPFTTRQLSIQISFSRRVDTLLAASDVLHSMISNSQDDINPVPHKYVDMGSLIQALEWICLHWKHRRKINGNIIAKVKSLVVVIIKIESILIFSGLYNLLFHWMCKRINYSLVSKMKKFLHLRGCSIQQRIFKESSKMNKISCNLFHDLTWWINNR